MKHVCLNTVPLINATSGVGFIVWTEFLYKWKAKQMQFGWILKCKCEDYSALFSKSLTVGSLYSVLVLLTRVYIWKWDISLPVKEFLCWRGLPLSELFYLCLPIMPQARRWHGWRLTVGRHEFPTAKAWTLCCLSPTAQGHVHAGQAFSRTLAIAHKLNEFSESSLCALPVMLAPPHELSCRFDPAVLRRWSGQWGICMFLAALECWIQMGQLHNQKQTVVPQNKSRMWIINCLEGWL